MGTLRLLHRWAGGLVGLVLALLGLSGALLAHEDLYLRLTTPHAADAQVTDPARIAATAGALFAASDRPRSIVLATDELGLHKLNYGDGAGAYASQGGEMVARWSSTWARPELWLFDFHHHLFFGDAGEMVAGIIALAGLLFVITGVILWWPARRLFALRLWPENLSRKAVVRQHRDLGFVLAPVLFVSLLTGAMMTLDKVEEAILSPFTPPAVLKAAAEPPKAKGGPLSPDFDWTAAIGVAKARFPDAELRSLALPAKPGALVTLRLRQPAEWLPNGRTMLWFDPADGRLVEVRDPLAQPVGVRLALSEYPIHAGKVGGLAYRLVITASGLALFTLGSFAVWTFWANPKAQTRKRKRLSTPAQTA